MNVDGGLPAWTTLPGASASASASTSYPSVTSKAATQSASHHKHSRITKEGYRLVDELYEINPYPTRAQKVETLAKIQSLPGCRHYTYQNLNQRLASHRSKRNHANDGGVSKNKHIATDATTSAQILYPSLLRDGVMRNLEILFRESPCPTPLVINTWADVLHVQREDVKTWVKLEREKLEQNPIRVAASQLPTPSSSCSPEPTSPITPTSPSYPVLPPFTRVDTKPVIKVQQDNKPPGAFPSKQHFHDLAERLHAARTRPEAAPMSAADAVKALDEHSERMTAFLQRYERGQYASIGLSPQLLDRKPTSIPMKTEPSSPTSLRHK